MYGFEVLYKEIKNVEGFSIWWIFIYYKNIKVIVGIKVFRFEV